VSLLDLSGRIGNKSKLLTDLFNREKKATTALRQRYRHSPRSNMQAKEFVIGIARSEVGYDFDAPDASRSYLRSHGAPLTTIIST